jgi:sugar lactone lactonase YvrE
MPGNIPVASGVPVSVSPAATTTYTLTVSDKGATVSTLTVTVTLVPVAPPTLAVVAGTPLLPGSANGLGGAAGFSSPQGVALDASGNLYVADTANGTIRAITPQGEVATLAGTPGVTGSSDGTGPAASFNAPQGVAVDASGNLFVTDTGNNTIRMITPGGVVSTLAGTAGITGSADGAGAAASFSTPTGVAVDRNGNVYVADSANNTIRQISSKGVVTTLAGTAGVAGSADATGAAASFHGPTGLAVDISGYVYVSDGGNNTIRRITAGGVVTTLAGTAGVEGSADGTGVAASFRAPKGLALDFSGNLYVADSGNHTLRMITPAGVVSTVAGVVGATGTVAGPLPAFLGSPAGVAVDPGTGYAFISVPDAIVEAFL